ncbi:glycerol-3-phosphate 1-O-acyltransferase PlsB [Glaciecola siphonariae]|uniref:Glycerol-3-phosphate acyltransferase n=1 Tax=Glaciecola siphonariae TaxID=521012 RepID=A0ABV9LT24_9ALTE
MLNIGSAFRWLVSKAVGWLVSVKSVPANLEKELGIDKSKPILYLLQTESFTDQVALEKSTKALGLPSVFEPIEIAGQERKRRYFLTRPQSLLTRRVSKTSIEDVFTEYFHLHREHPEIDLQILPVFISWGRSAGKEKSGFAQLFASKASPNWLRKLFIVLIFGRDNFVSYSPAVSTRQMSQLHGSDKQIAQKLVRVARTHFQRKRQTLSGPTLLERQTLYNSILGASSVKSAISDEVKHKAISYEKGREDALAYINEISADYREGLIRIGDRLLKRVWNKIYDGIEVGHPERVRELAQNGHEIIYVPCHRSHMDYLLLTYVIYHEGLVTPHIAAGINLNFWPVGGILRRCGAFYLRRSFAGNKLYTAVFREYLELLFNKGYSVKYFPEGGRSRTGRLLPPKTGMLAMTLQALAKGINRPVSIVPVYIGYEHVMEVKSYMKELKGKSKKKESPTQVFSAIRKLKNYGHGFVNFGEPIALSQFLDESVSDWREQKALEDKKPKWLTPVVNALADKVMTRINRAAALNGTAMVALCLLSSKTQIMSKKALVQSMSDYLALFNDVRYSEDCTLPNEPAAELVDRTLALNRFEQGEDAYGAMVSPKDSNGLLLTFYRNNILHMFALPSLIMAAVFAHKNLEKTALQALVATLFPLLKREFFMHQSLEEAAKYIDALIVHMTDKGLLIQKDDCLAPPPATHEKFHSSWLLSRAMQETWQRYAIVLHVLEKEKVIGRSQLERQSQIIAERLSALFGMHSPEFYDKNVLSSFVNALRENEHVKNQDDGNFAFSQSSLALKEAILPLVWPEIIQHLEQI